MGDRWESLLEEQSNLFRSTVTENQELKRRVTELNRELGVWKLALAKADEDAATLKAKNIQLESLLSSLKNDNPVTLCLIDGDGHIFQKELIAQGETGGRQAAMHLTKGLTDYTAANGKVGTLWLTVYCNKTGLVETLVNQDICTKEQFEDFCLGFIQAAPLFSILDVGQGKEAADGKIKECLRVFTRFPQISFVFFGGAHDNGYTSALASLQNEGFLHKLVLLRGYKEVAFELRNLQLPELTIEGIFMTHKLLTHNFPRTRGHVHETPKSSSSSSHYSGDEPRYLEPGVKTHLLAHFSTSPPASRVLKCTYGHDYAKKSPCPLVNRNKVCPAGELNCPSGHYCPRGDNCSFHKRVSLTVVSIL
ncbi:hypothetical protein FB45DRAFT_917110 [Roridomyces roridus]|uniref:DUF7923 domain-containing protein n=1 Tax=Roridomyces roridus TaxID=1738132 RepID=A0AAD7BUP1_9AGAR|nr:hypothetical protein FB45DRAFT_917110 [Roridomyces roridus]